MSLLDDLQPDLYLKPLDRFDLYAFLGHVRVMEPYTEVLMQQRAERELKEDEYDSPHSRPWFVSFHGSEFPGEEQDACQRYLAYRMMNFPSTEVMPPWVTTTGTLGKAGELDIADAWWQGGGMLAIPENANDFQARMKLALSLAQDGRVDQAIETLEQPAYHQLGFVDEEHWMTVSTDLPILHPGWRRPHIVEVKGKADTILDEMLEGKQVLRDGRLEMVPRYADPRHALQVKATLGKAHEYDWGSVTVCPNCWFIVWADIYERLGIAGGIHPRSDSFGHCPRCPRDRGYDDKITFELEPPTTAEIYYWSRSWPRKTKSFYYTHDQQFMDDGLKVLAEVRDHYLNDTIPPRPDHFQWSVGPCGNCSFKPFCKHDFGLRGQQRKPRPENVQTRLALSAGVDHTYSLRPRYDPDATRSRVLQEWE